MYVLLPLCSAFYHLTTALLPMTHSRHTSPPPTGQGSYLCRSVPSGSMGLLRWVQSVGGENVVCCLAADPDNPGVSQGEGAPSVKWVTQLYTTMLWASFQAFSPAAYHVMSAISLDPSILSNPSFLLAIYNVHVCTITTATNAVGREELIYSI